MSTQRPKSSQKANTGKIPCDKCSQEARSFLGVFAFCETCLANKPDLFAWIERNESKALIKLTKEIFYDAN